MDFEEELGNLIHRHKEELGLSNDAIIGFLELMIMALEDEDVE